MLQIVLDKCMYCQITIFFCLLNFELFKKISQILQIFLSIHEKFTVNMNFDNENLDINVQCEYIMLYLETI